MMCYEVRQGVVLTEEEIIRTHFFYVMENLKDYLGETFPGLSDEELSFLAGHIYDRELKGLSEEEAIAEVQKAGTDPVLAPLRAFC